MTDPKKIIEFKNYCISASQDRRTKWLECWKMYVSHLDASTNPFLANLFIPKSHEAVELLAAFLSGPNQSISAEPEGKEDTLKAGIIEKLLNFQWRKVLKARSKILTWIKQTILFGNGIMKVGWDSDLDEPFINPVSISDVYFNPFIADIQDSSVIHRLLKPIEEVKKDDKYNDYRRLVIRVGDDKEDEEKSKFRTYDLTGVSSFSGGQKVELFEVWTKDKLQTVADTVNGYQFLRNEDNPYGFIPFVKMRCKNNPLPNRAYDFGVIEPTIKLQKAFNDSVNEFFDNVSLINNKMWIKRRGAAINPMDLVRRPGGHITVSDINKDIRADEVSDIKPSLLELIKFIDDEFQQASLVSNLLKGVYGAGFATEAAIGQQNVQTMMDMLDQNIKDAFSELGNMLVEINLKYLKGVKSIKVLDNEKEIAWLEVNMKEIQGKYDIKIEADRSASYSRIVRQKQLLDLLAILSNDQEFIQRHPKTKEKIYKKWLSEAGFANVDYFFEDDAEFADSEVNLGYTPPAVRVDTETPRRDELLTQPAIERSIMQKAMPGKSVF